MKNKIALTDNSALTNLNNCVKIKVQVKLLRKDIHI